MWGGLAMLILTVVSWMRISGLVWVLVVAVLCVAAVFCVWYLVGWWVVAVVSWWSSVIVPCYLQNFLLYLGCRIF
jgi:hypothetical protein